MENTKNVFVVVTKTVNGKGLFLLADECRLPIFYSRKDAESTLLKYNRDAPNRIRYTIRKINFKYLHDLIK